MLVKEQEAANILPYFLTRYKKKSGSLPLTDMIAPTSEKDVAYHGPGNPANECRN